MKTIIFGSIISFVLFFGNRVEAQVVDSVAVVREVDSLIQVSRMLADKRSFDKAFEINAVAENLASTNFGRESAIYGKSWFNRGRVFHRKSSFQEAEKCYLEAAGILKNTLGKEHPIYATCLHNLAILYSMLGKNEKAEPLYIEAKGIREKVLGKEHPDYAWSLMALGNLYSSMGNYQKTEPLYIEATNIYEKTLGKEHPEYAGSLINLASLYKDIGNYEKAEALYISARGILEKATRKQHPNYAVSVGNLAVLYYHVSKYEKAEPLFREAIEIQEKSLGKEHPEYALNLSNLAGLYLFLGNYEKAEILFKEVINIRQKTLGTEHYYYASSLNNLAILYRALGNYEKAEALFTQAKDILAKTLGTEHSDYASSLNGLANLYSILGDNKKSENFYIEVKDIRAKVFGTEHSEYAESINNLAIFYRGLGDYEKAERFCIEANVIFEKTLSKNHPNYAKNLISLANLYKDLGNYKKTEPLYIEANDIRAKVLGVEHPDYVSNLYNLAELYWAIQKYDSAKSFLVEAHETDKSLLGKALRHLIEQELFSYISQFSRGQNLLFSFAQAHTGMSTRSYENALFLKGFALNAVSQVHRLALSDSISAEKYYQLKSYYRRLATEYTKPIAERQNVPETEDKANEIEKELTRTIAGFGEANRQVQWQEVQHTLKPSEAAIEFVHYQLSNPQPTDSIIYTALILLPQDTAPHFIPLFEEKQLSTLLSKTQNSAQSVGNLYAAARSGIVLDEKPAYGTELYNLIWKPLDSLLQGIKTVYFSPSGLLHRVNLSAIPVDSTLALADKYTLRQMSSTRNLVVKTPVLVPTGYTAALFGGIQYNSDSTTLSSAALASRGSETPASRSTLEYTSDVQRDTAKAWNYLEGTRAEVDSLQRQIQRNGLNVKTFTGLAATEESLKALGRDTAKSPDILHIATHGFFFDDPEKRREQRFGDENVFRWNENPLFRSGLIMAGADHAWQTGRPYANLEDGICTAYEISHLNLTNTKLAVLSACETGLGDIEGSEGVYGLQRAFKMAGVDYLIVSLWKVPDAQTVEFMDAFYKNWLGGQAIHEAFAQAQQMMRRKYGVYEWGAWVLIG